MNGAGPAEEFDAPRTLRQQLAAAHDDLRTSAGHDAAILAAAAAPAPARMRRRAWQVPATLAAGLLLGVLLSWTAQFAWRPAGGAKSGLEIPVSELRGAAAPAGAHAIPVERADPDAWYRYIEELLATGQQHEAQRHLQRFNELHPGYVHQP
ncbi:MAG: hypothetical protein U1F06_01160 [Steroidobacteraceae bacterium]